MCKLVSIVALAMAAGGAAALGGAVAVGAVASCALGRCLRPEHPPAPQAGSTGAVGTTV